MQSACLSFSTDTPSADNCDVLLNGGCNTGNLYWQVNLADSSFGILITVLNSPPLRPPSRRRRRMGRGWYKFGTVWPPPVWTECDDSSEYVQI
jgi:hypothetical protein